MVQNPSPLTACPLRLPLQTKQVSSSEMTPSFDQLILDCFRREQRSDSIALLDFPADL